MDSVLVFWPELATNLRGSFTIMEKALTSTTSAFTSKNQCIAMHCAKQTTKHGISRREIGMLTQRS